MRGHTLTEAVCCGSRTCRVVGLTMLLVLYRLPQLSMVTCSLVSGIPMEYVAGLLLFSMEIT